MRAPINVSKRDRAGVKAPPAASPAPEPRHRTDPRSETPQTRAGMTIGKLAKLAGVSTDTLRFYEEEGLLTPAKKTGAGYRMYDEDAVRRLGFIRQAQHCGMTLSEIRQLLEMKADDRSCCSDVRGLAISKKLQLQQKIKMMKAMSHALSELIEICTDEGRPLDDCPILAALESSMANQQRESH